MSAILHQQLMAAYGAASGGGSSDPNFSNVALLLHMEGANGSTIFTDSGPTPKSVTVNGTAQISTAQARFGASSGLFPQAGGNNSISVPLVIGAADFTVEGWFMISQTAQRNVFVNTFDISSTGGTNFFVSRDGSNFIFATQAGNQITINTAISLNVWYHIALTRQSGTFRLFIDGVGGTPHTPGTNPNYGTKTVRFGFDAFNNRTTGVRLDEVRWTENVARYTANFTPPSAPFPDA